MSETPTLVFRTENSYDPSTQNVKLSDVPGAFESVSQKGQAIKVTGEPWIPNIAESHVQGFVTYNNSYALATYNNKGYSNGQLCTIDLSSHALISSIDTPPANYNHPCGMQIIGDYCVMAIENSAYKQSFVYFYDMTTIGIQKTPTPLSYVLPRPQAGAGAAAITNFTDQSGVERYLLGVYDNGTIDFYVSDGQPLPNPTFGDIQFSVQTEHGGYSNISLLTDVGQGLWLVGYRSSGTIVYDDYMDLYQITLQDGGTTKISTSMSIHMVTDHGGGVVGVDGVHFRWGAGLQINPDGSLTMLATQRNFVANMFWYNTFSTPS